jgi:hypothetical protein
LIRFECWLNKSYNVSLEKGENPFYLDVIKGGGKLDISTSDYEVKSDHECLICKTPNWGFGDPGMNEYVCIPCLIKMVKKVKELD